MFTHLHIVRYIHNFCRNRLVELIVALCVAILRNVLPCDAVTALGLYCDY